MMETMKKNSKSLLVAAVVILLPMLAGIILWDRLPERMATHWGIDGSANGWNSRAFTVFGIPLVLLAIHAVCVVVSGASAATNGQNPKLLCVMHMICPTVSLIVGAAVYPYALGMEISIAFMALLFLGVVLLVVGNYLPKTVPNHWLGIRIPWTYASEENWAATHRFGGKVYAAAGLGCIVCAFIPVAAVRAGMTVLALAACFVPVLYSYLYARRHG